MLLTTRFLPLTTRINVDSTDQIESLRLNLSVAKSCSGSLQSARKVSLLIRQAERGSPSIYNGGFKSRFGDVGLDLSYFTEEQAATLKPN